MASVNFPIQLVRGAGATLTLTLKDTEGEAINLTGSKVIFAVKNKKDTIELFDSDSAALIFIEQSTHTFPLIGKTVIALTNELTDLKPSQYVYGIKVVPASGESIPSKPAPFIIEPRVVEGE